MSLEGRVGVILGVGQAFHQPDPFLQPRVPTTPPHTKGSPGWDSHPCRVLSCPL